MSRACRRLRNPLLPTTTASARPVRPDSTQSRIRPVWPGRKVSSSPSATFHTLTMESRSPVGWTARTTRDIVDMGRQRELY